MSTVSTQNGPLSMGRGTMGVGPHLRRRLAVLLLGAVLVGSASVAALRSNAGFGAGWQMPTLATHHSGGGGLAPDDFDWPGLKVGPFAQALAVQPQPNGLQDGSGV